MSLNVRLTRYANHDRGVILMVSSNPSDDERDQTVENSSQASEEARTEAADVIDEVISRLDKLSKELRKQGVYPLAHQLDRDRERFNSRAGNTRSD
jgi:hypothetical protein